MPETTHATMQLMSSAVLVDGVLRPGIVTVEHGTVASVLAPIPAAEGTPGAEDEAPVIDVGDTPILPAPIDLHLHGAGGVAVPPAGSADALDRAIARLCEQERWARPDTALEYDYLATLPAPSSEATGVDDLLAHVEAAAAAARDSRRCRGLRLEGVFLNAEMAGVWHPHTLRPPDVGLLEELVAAARGPRPLRIVDVAPELPGAIELIERACELGLVASIAHSNATWEQAKRGIDAGATLATHVFNAMRAFHHRDPGVVAAVLADPRVSCELVCDGTHLHPGAIALAAAAAPGRIVAVSDAAPAAGQEPGVYEWLGTKIEAADGQLRTAEGAIAGSARLLTAAPALLREAGLVPLALLQALTLSPARVLDPFRSDSLEPGDRAWVPGW